MQVYTLVLLLEVQLDNLYLNLFKIVKIIFIFHVVDISFFYVYVLLIVMDILKNNWSRSVYWIYIFFI
jgi:hypothetical protein